MTKLLLYINTPKDNLKYINFAFTISANVKIIIASMQKLTNKGCVQKPGNH